MLTRLGYPTSLPRPKPAASQANEPFSEKMVWDQLKTVYDPEIPVNIADLGLIYSCQIKDLDQGAHRIDIEMSLTAPGCGMGNVLKSDVETKLAKTSDRSRSQRRSRARSAVGTCAHVRSRAVATRPGPVKTAP